MAAKVPYMVSVGNIPKILSKIQEARAPDRFTLDFLETKLGSSGGGARPIIPLLKKMGFLSSDGTPTQRYHRFRNEDTSGQAVAEGMKEAFDELFSRNEYVYELPREKLASLVVEITGAAKDDRTTTAAVGTFCALNELADFDISSDFSAEDESSQTAADKQDSPAPAYNVPQLSKGPSYSGPPPNAELRVGYTINLNLPETSDPAVFNAIFKALRENLLGQ